MSWTVVWTAQAERDLRNLDRLTAQRVREAIRRLAETGQGDVLKAGHFAWRRG